MTFVSVPPVAVCPCCLFTISNADPERRCPACQTPHHQVCWDELGGCAIYGCPQMVEVRKAGGDDVNWWGQTAKTISMAELECPFCHTKFEDIRPIQREDLFATPKQRDPAARGSAVRLLIFSTLGFFSPITLLIGLVWYLRKKKELLEAGGSTRALVLISIVVSVLYVVIILGGWALFVLKKAAGDAAL